MHDIAQLRDQYDEAFLKGAYRIALTLQALHREEPFVSQVAGLIERLRGLLGYRSRRGGAL
jgi:hypothetical protein